MDKKGDAAGQGGKEEQRRRDKKWRMAGRLRGLSFQHSNKTKAAEQLLAVAPGALLLELIFHRLVMRAITIRKWYWRSIHTDQVKSIFTATDVS